MGRKQYSAVGWLTQETGRPVGQQEAGHFKALWPWSEKALKFSGAKYSVKEDREREMVKNLGQRIFQRKDFLKQLPPPRSLP